MKTIRIVALLGLALFFLALLVPLADADDVASSEASGELGVGTETHSDVPFSEATGTLGIGVEDDDQGENRKTTPDVVAETATATWPLEVLVIALILTAVAAVLKLLKP